MLFTNFTSKMFEGFQSYKDMVAILAMWLRCRELTYILRTQYLALFGEVVSQKAIADGRWRMGIL